MKAIQQNAELAVKSLLKETYHKFGGRPLEAVDYMDDGSPIKLRITIDGEKGVADFDFTGTGPEVYGKFTFLEHRREQRTHGKLPRQEAPMHRKPSFTRPSSMS